MLHGTHAFTHSRFAFFSDAVFTPVVEDEGALEWWDKTKQNFGDLFEEYGSAAWTEYKGRAWCRLECFVAGG